MAHQPGTLGHLIADLMRKQKHSNRSLASAAGVSDTAIRNLLKYGVDNNAKDPDARTLRRVADALGVEPLRLFRLAGYIPPEDRMYSARAEYLAKVFDRLTAEKQQALIGIIETMVDDESASSLEAMKSDAQNPLAGLGLEFPAVLREIANQLIVMLDMTTPADVRLIPPDTQIMHFNWNELPLSTQQQIKALIERHGSLAAFVWRFEPPAHERPARLTREALAALDSTTHSTALSKELKRAGFGFVGPTTVYAFMQAMGLVNDHLESCPTREAALEARKRFTPPR